MKNSSVEITSGVFGYGRKVILDNVSVQWSAGNIHCIFGRNGSGKTTLLKSLSRLIPMLGGEFKISQQNAFDVPPAQFARMVSVVMVSRPFVSGMRIIDFVRYGRYPYSNWLGMCERGGDELIYAALRDCGIFDQQERFINELSDGEMQKVQIARAVAQDSPLMLLDEPVAHLDIANKAEIFNILKNISKAGKTILFTSHDLVFSSQLSDTFTVIHNGKANSMNRNEFVESRIYESVLGNELLEIDLGRNSISYKSR